MSESNAELMKRALEGFNDQGWESVMPLFADEFELVTPPGLAAEPDTYRGKEGIRRYWDSFYEVMEEVRVEPGEFHEVDDWVLVPFRMIARGRTTGIESGLDAVMAWRWRDGQAIRALVFPSLDEARAAVPPRE